MAPAGQGHSRNILLSGPWSIPCPLYRDELLTSWLVRSALANSCDPLALTGSIWPGWRPWILDIDRQLPVDKLKALARTCGVPLDVLESVTLEAIAAAVSGKRLPPGKAWPWILSIGVRNRLRSGGLQYCPECFRSDVPYFRRQWRLVWHMCCEAHGCMLSDCCPHCGMPLEPHRLEATQRSVATCPNCCGNLADAEAGKALVSALRFQQAAEQAIRGNGKFGREKLPVAEWFELASFLVQLVKRVARNSTPALVAFGRLASPAPIPTHSPQVEKARIADRVPVLGCVGNLLASGKESLASMLAEAGVGRQGFCPKGVRLPACLSDVASSLKRNHAGNRSHPSAPSGGLPPPRPRYEVQRRALRIRRRLEGAAP